MIPPDTLLPLVLLRITSGYCNLIHCSASPSILTRGLRAYVMTPSRLAEPTTGEREPANVEGILGELLLAH